MHNFGHSNLEHHGMKNTPEKYRKSTEQMDKNEKLKTHFNFLSLENENAFYPFPFMSNSLFRVIHCVLPVYV